MLSKNMNSSFNDHSLLSSKLAPLVANYRLFATSQAPHKKNLSQITSSTDEFNFTRNYWRAPKGGYRARKAFYGYWRKLGQRLQPFCAQRRRFKVYGSWVERDWKFPMRYRTVRSLQYMPKYINYRQLFHNQMLEIQTFRKLFRLTSKQLVKHFHKAVRSSKRLFDQNFIKYFEYRLDVTAYRANFAFSYMHSRQVAKKGAFLVNNRPMSRPNFALNVGDCITLNWHYLQTRCPPLMRMICRPLQLDQYPSHLIFNERIPAAIVFSNPDCSRIKHTLPVSWQFISFAILKYN